MKPGPVLEAFRAHKEAGRKTIAWLIDPDKADPDRLRRQLAHAQPPGLGFIFIGGSIVASPNAEAVIKTIKYSVRAPVVLFPGHSQQLTPGVDAVLFLSLISGRNPDLLFGQHIHAAPYLRHHKLEPVPTGYILVDGGKVSAAQYLSGTNPLPAHKPEIAAYVALAGTYLGLQVIYMDGGSGAPHPIPGDLVRAVAATVDTPIVVGGGVRRTGDAEMLFRAGADVVVVGNALEVTPDGQLLRDMLDTAIRCSRA